MIEALSERYPLFRNVLLLVGGSALTAAAIVLSAPILSRIYEPRAFGALAVYSSIVTMLCSFTSLRYESAIPLPEEHGRAANVLALAFLVLIALSGLLSVFLIGFRAEISGWLRTPELAPYFWLIPLGLVGNGAFQILGYWALRKERFPLMARTRITQGVGTVVVQLIWGAVSPGLAGLIAGDLSGRVGGVARLGHFAWADLPRQAITWAEIRSVAIRYRDFPLLNSAAAALTAVSTQIPPVLLSHFFEPAIAGYYALTSRAMAVPAALVGQAVGQAFFARAALIRNDKAALRQLTETTALLLLAGGVPVFGAVLLDGQGLFGTVFGQQWRQSGVYAQWLAPWFLLWLIANPLSNLLTVREWQGTTLKYSALECLAKTAALSWGIWLGSDQIAVALLGAAAFLLSLFTMNRFFEAAYSSMLDVLPRAKWSVLLGALSLVIAAVAVQGTGTWHLALRLSIFLLCYCGLAFRTKEQFV